MRIYEPKTKEDFDRYYDLRWRLLRKPWNQSKGSEKDDLEDKSIHVMVCEKDRIPIGVGRAQFNSCDEAQIRYMAVEEDHQGNGFGSLVLQELEKRVKENNAKYVILNAREFAVDFYKKYGYRIVGKSYTLFGSINHLKMRKDL